MGDSSFPDIDWTLLSGQSPYSDLFRDVYISLPKPISIIQSPSFTIHLVLCNNNDLVTDHSIDMLAKILLMSPHFLISFQGPSLPHVNRDNSSHYILKYTKTGWLNLFSFLHFWTMTIVLFI